MSVWRNRNFVILFSGQILSVAGDNLFNIALLWYVLELTHSKSDVVLTSFVTALPPLLGLFTGVLVDRWLKRTTMLYSDVIRAIILLTLFWLSVGNNVNFWMILILVLLLESVGTVFTPSFNSLLPHVLSKNQFTSASGTLQSTTAMATLGGMLGGGALMTLVGAPLLFLGDGISFLMSVFSLMFVHSAEPQRGKAEFQLIQEWKMGFRELLRDNFILQVGLRSALNNFSLGAFDMVFVVYVKTTLHGTALTLSLLLGAFLLGVIVGGLVTGKMVGLWRYQWVMTLSTFALGIAVGASGLCHNPYVDVVVLSLGGVSLGLLDGASGGVMLHLVPVEIRGRITSILFTMSRMSIPLGVATIGALLVHLTPTQALLLTGVSPVVCGLTMFTPSTRRALAKLDDIHTTGETAAV